MPGATIDAARNVLIGGRPTMNLKELAEAAGCEVAYAERFWRAMGFPDLKSDEDMFTELDLASLKSWLSLMSELGLKTRSATSLLRAQSHTMDRLVLWQTEAIVQDLVSQYDLDDTTARLLLLDRIDQFTGILEKQVRYAWRRQLAALLTHIDDEVGQRGMEDMTADTYPLRRTMGFVDMVAYTRRSAGLGAEALADLVEGFEFRCRDVVTRNGGRVVKTIGDAVLWVCDDLATGLRVASKLVHTLVTSEELLPVRASLVCGRVVSRSGDIFGPPVNLASRLVDIAPRASIFMDEQTAQMLYADSKFDDSLIWRADPADLRGVGTVVPYFLDWEKYLRTL